MVQAMLFRIFWAFVAVFIDKNDCLIFFPFDFHSLISVIFRLISV